MPSTTNEVESLLNRAVDLLVSPTLANLRTVEDVLREAIVRFPEDLPGDLAAGVATKVRLCERLLAGAEAGRPGLEPQAAAYSPQGEKTGRRPLARAHRLELEA